MRKLEPFQQGVVDHIESLSGNEKLEAQLDAMEVMHDEYRNPITWLLLQIIRFAVWVNK